MTREFKQSDLEWYDCVPLHWKKMKIGWLYRVIASGTTPPSHNMVYYDGGIPWLNTGDLNDGEILSTSKTITTEALQEFSTLKLYSKDSLVMAMYGATIGKLGITKIETTTNQACCVMSQPINIDSKFVFYWLLGNRKEIINLSHGGGQPNINQNIIKSLKLYVPSFEEQHAIAQFLDDKTSEIDSLIADKEKLIELLEEKRQAIITEAVTRGLNPNVKMKDSGVEWIGEIPKHWEVSRLDFNCRVKARLGWKGLKASEYVDEGYIFLSTPNIKSRKIDFDNVNYITEHRYLESPEIILEKGDVLLAKDGSTLGTVNVIRELPSPATVNSSIAVLRAKESIDSIYLYYFLSCNYTQHIIQQLKDGMGVPHLFQSNIRKFILIVPPRDEQEKISQYLDKRLDEIEIVISDIKEQISKLKEYRQSLIYEAVRGKIDVREYNKVLA